MSSHDYKNMKELQEFYKKLIELIMNGDLSNLKLTITNYSDNINHHATISDIINEFQSEGKTLLHLAAGSGHVAIVQYILDNCYSIFNLINKQDNNGMTPLINATISESYDIMKLLLSHKALVNIPNKDGATAIHFASSDGSLERLQLLIKSGGDLTIKSSAGNALHWAAGKGRYEIVKYLLDNSVVDPNEVSGSGLPPVIMAAVAHSEATVCLLLKANVNVGFILSGNLTLLHICAENGMKDAVDLIVKSVDGIKCANIETTDGNLPIHLAAMSKYEEIIETLIPVTTAIKDKYIDRANVDIINELLIEGEERLHHWNNKNNNKSSDNNNTNNIPIYSKPIDEETKAEVEKHKQLGNSYYSSKQYNEAIIEYTKGIDLDETNQVLWSNRSASYLQIKDYQNALKDAEICRRLDPTWPKGCYRLAAARLALELYEDAAVAAYEGLKLDNNNKELKKIIQDSVRLGREQHAKLNS